MARALLACIFVALTGCSSFRPTHAVAALPAPGAFPHDLLDEVLSRFVDDAGRVDYRGLRDDRATFDRYLAYVAALSPHAHPDRFPTRNDALAYWLNAYNALAIAGVLARPGLTSVADHKVAFFYGTRYLVGGRKLSLYRMENGILRKAFRDPRVHFALNCQSAGCPTLPRHALHPDHLDEELDEAAHAFVTDPRHVRLAEDGAVELSEIFKWYAEDFAPLGGPLRAANRWGAALPEDADIRWIPYDWTLIAQPGRGP